MLIHGYNSGSKRRVRTERPMNMDYEVIIVGGRVAGSILAALLGKRGHRTLLLERAHFPSDTLSTHFFRWPALQAFQPAARRLSKTPRRPGPAPCRPSTRR